MAGSSSIVGDQTVTFTDNLSFDGTDRGGALSADGQLWIGSATSNRADNGGHVRVGNITGSGGITVTNGPGTINIAGTGPASDLHAPRFIVASSTAGTGANFTTIAAAVASAQGTGIPSTIFIQPGTYNENIVLPAGISLTAFDCNGVGGDTIINGKISCSASNTTNQNCISGLYLQTNGDYCLEVTGSNICLVKVIQCFFSCSGNSGIHLTNANGSIMLKECTGNTGVGTGIFVATTSATGTPNQGLLIVDCFFDNSSGASTTASTIAAGQCQIFNSRFCSTITTSGTAAFTLGNSTIDCGAINTTALTIGGSGTNDIYNSFLSSGTATALVMTGTGFVEGSEVRSSNAAAISGAGTLNYSNISYRGTSSAVTTTTQVPLAVSNNAVVLKTPGAYPYTTVPQDAVILVDTSSARTITPLASPTTGQKHIIKDSVGSAAANNITITPSGKNIDGAASILITTNYGSETIVFNGTEWNRI